jgi:hypothetical protein
MTFTRKRDVEQAALPMIIRRLPLPPRYRHQDNNRRMYRYFSPSADRASLSFSMSAFLTSSGVLTK